MRIDDIDRVRRELEIVEAQREKLRAMDAEMEGNKMPTARKLCIRYRQLVAELNVDHSWLTGELNRLEAKARIKKIREAKHEDGHAENGTGRVP